MSMGTGPLFARGGAGVCAGAPQGRKVPFLGGVWFALRDEFHDGWRGGGGVACWLLRGVLLARDCPKLAVGRARFSA